jgi:hypothetical protein
MGKKAGKEYLAAIRGRYRKARRKERGAILREFCAVCGYIAAPVQGTWTRTGYPKPPRLTLNFMDSAQLPVWEITTPVVFCHNDLAQ